MTRSARVNGLRGLAASLLISSSGICALEGGCDHVWTAGGTVDVVLLLVVARKGGTWARFARDRRRIMAAACSHVDKPISSKSTGRKMLDVASTLLLAWGRRFDRLDSVTRGARRPISSFVGHLINTGCFCIMTRYFPKYIFPTAFLRKINRKAPCFQSSQGNIIALPISRLALRNQFTPSLFNSKLRCLSTM